MDERIGKWFWKSELQCKCGCGKYIPNKELLGVLDEVRDYFGVPVAITSSTRCEEHNDKVGGMETSQHLLGTACDIQVRGIEPSLVASYLEDKYPWEYGIGKYYNFTHIDVREKKARW